MKDARNDKLLKVITVRMTVIQAMAIIGGVQLATRHPKYNGPSSEVAVTYAKFLQDELDKVAPEYSALMEMGWNPDFDIE